MRRDTNQLVRDGPAQHPPLGPFRPGETAFRVKHGTATRQVTSPADDGEGGEQMSSMSPEQNTDLPRATTTGAKPEPRPETTDESVLETIGAARARLIEVEMTLRDLWYETVDSGPALSARLNVAARLAHNAAEALSPQTLL